MPKPARFEGRSRTSPKGGNRGAVLRVLAEAMSYGDLNGGSGLRKLDGGTKAAAPAPRLAMFGRQDPDFGGGGVQERGIPATTTMGVRVSLVR
jgi:hypothetical protein